MKIKVLGCSGGEFPGRSLPSFLLDDKILFDAGGFTNILSAKEQLKIETIFITHAHLDHIRGIPFLADNILVGRWDRQVRIFSISPVIKSIKKHLLNSSIWPDFSILPNPQKPILTLFTMKVNKPFPLGDYRITPYRVNHPVPSVGFFVEDQRGKCFFYTGDTGPLGTTWEKMKDKQMDCLIIEASFPNQMEELALRAGHLTPSLLKNEISKIKYPPQKICIIHLKHQYLKIIKAELRSLKINHLRILRDGDIIEV